MATRLSDSVHVHLRDQILAGELAPGDPVPSERELSEQLGVNRHAIREALNRLQQARLIQVSQGGPTRVLDWRRTGGLELIVDLVNDTGEPLEPELVRAVVELRACVGADVARRCAERGASGLREQAAHLSQAAAGAASLEQRARANEALWTCLVEGAENIAYRLSLNSLLQGVAAHPELNALLNTPAGDAQLCRDLGAAVRAGRPDDAADAARRLLELPLT